MINTNDATKLLPSPKSLPKNRTNCKVKGCTRQIQSNFSGHCCRCYKDKYPNRYESNNKDFHRDKNLKFLNYLNDLLKENNALNCPHLSMLD